MFYQPRQKWGTSKKNSTVRDWWSPFSDLGKDKAMRSETSTTALWALFTTIFRPRVHHIRYTSRSATSRGVHRELRVNYDFLGGKYFLCFHVLGPYIGRAQTLFLSRCVCLLTTYKLWRLINFLHSIYVFRVFLFDKSLWNHCFYHGPYFTQTTAGC